MKSFKEFTKKQKTIAAVTVAGLVLAGGIIGVATMTDGIDNTPATEQTEVKKQALELTLEFNETPDKEYKVKVDEKELVIQTSEVKPKIETNKIGTTKHEVKIGKETFLLTVKVQDSRKISLAEFDKLTVDTKTSKEDLETKIKEGLTKKDEKEKLTFAFDYSDDFKLDAAGEQEVKVTAHFENNKRKSLTQKVIVTIEEAKVEEETPETNTETPASTPSDSGSTSNNSGSTSSNSGSTSSSSGSTSSNSGSTSSNSGSTSNNSGSKPSASAPVTSVGSGTSVVDEQDKNGGAFVPSTPAAKPSAPAAKPSTPAAKPSTPAPAPAKPSTPAPTPAPAPAKPTTPSVSLPSGVTQSGSDASGATFNVKRSLPGGGSITEGGVDKGRKNVIFMGIDNKGNVFGAEVTRGHLAYVGNFPTLSPADDALLRELGSQILSAYGM